MGTPTRLRHYRAQPSPSQVEAEASKMASASQPTSSKNNLSTLDSPKDASSNEPTYFKKLPSTSTPAKDTANNTSRRTFAINPTGSATVVASSDIHKRSSSNNTSISSDVSSISSISTASSALRNGNVSYASIVASKQVIPPSSRVDDKFTKKGGKCDGDNDSSYRFYRSAINTANAPSQAEKSKNTAVNANTPSFARDSLPSSSSRPTDGSKMMPTFSPSSNFTHPNPSYQSYSNNGEIDPFHTSMSHSTSSNERDFTPLNWMSSSSSSSSTSSPFRQASLQPNTSTPEKNGYSHWKEHPYQSPSTPNWTGSPAYFAPFAAQIGVIGSNNGGNAFQQSPFGGSSTNDSPNLSSYNRSNEEGPSFATSLLKQDNRTDDSTFYNSTSSNQTSIGGASSAPFGLDWQSFDNSHSRNITQSINSTNSTNNESDLFSSFDRSFKAGNTTADTSASLHRGHSPNAFDPKATFTTAPTRHTRQISNDGSLYSFDGLAVFSSSRSFDVEDVDNSRPLNQGNTSLSNISDLNLDDLGHCSDPIPTTSNITHTGKVGNDGQIHLGQKEQSDLDNLYRNFHLQENSSTSPSHNNSSTLPTLREASFQSSPNTFSPFNAKNISVSDDVNFSKSVSDAYREVKLNNENEESRYLFVSRLPIPDDDVDGQTLVNEITEAIKIYGQVKGLYVRHLTYTGCLLLSFNDYRHTATARKNILRDSRRNPAWGHRQLSAEFIERDQVVKLAQGQFATSFLSLGEGKLTLSASTTFQFDGLQAYFSALGDVKSFGIDPASSAQEGVNGTRSYLIEYFDDRCAARAWADISGAENADLQIGWQDSSSLNVYLLDENKPSQPDTSKNTRPRPPLPSSFPSYPEDRFTRYKKTAWTEFPSNNLSPIASPLPDGFKSATTLPSTSLKGNRNGNALALLGYVPNDPARNSTAQWGLIRDDPVPDNNLIRFDRIMSGEDKRTSCILRNLPNRMTQLELMENLDEVVPREYDFVYLRFDFNSGSNCSYSFVNFTSSDALLRFWNAKLGTFWDKDNSRKLCMGGMAAIQGKQALVERFRNSSVMDAKEEHQPKIFHSSGPMKGLPEPFPLSNNALRKARSSYATSVYGLYGSKPRGGFKHVLI